MASLSSNVVDNLVEGICKIKCKHRHDKNVELNLKIVSAFLNTQNLMMIQQNPNDYAVIEITKKN